MTVHRSLARTASLVLSLLFIVPSAARADDPTAAPAGQIAPGTPVAPGAARGPGEAPGAPMAPMPPEVDPGRPDPAAQRSMTFSSSGVGECRESVPGGTLLAVAYAVVLAVLGAYVALLARKNSRLAADLEELEAELERRRGPSEGTG